MFGTKKTIVVSSTVQNLAGDEADRPDFMKNSIFAAIMSPHNPYLGETIVRNLLTGPGMNQRHFIKWAIRTEYPGLPTFYVTRQDEVDPAVVAPFIPIPPTPAGQAIDVQSAQVVEGNYGWVVEQYVLANYPENYDTEYVSSYNKALNEITIQWELGGTVTFSAGSWNPRKAYVVANFYLSIPEAVQGLVTGATTSGDTSQPSTAGYTLISSVDDSETCFDLDQHVLEEHYWTGIPTLPSPFEVEYDQTVNECGTGVVEEWRKTVYNGGDGNTEETSSTEFFLYFHKTYEVYQGQTVDNFQSANDPIPGQTRRITTTTTLDHLRAVYEWRVDTQDTIDNEIIGGGQIFSYEIGTGNATLDALLEELTVSDQDAEYFPFLPIRLDNESINHPMYDDITGSGLYEKTNRAYWRATGRFARISKLIDIVEENESIDDIDYSFIQYGVALNVIEPACRKYIYKWLSGMIDHQVTTSTYMDEYSDEVSIYVGQWAAMNAWVYAQADPLRNGYGDPRPNTPKLNNLKSNSATLRCADPQLENLDMRLSWVNITETSHSGTPTNPDTGQPATQGDIWIANGTDLEWTVVKGIYPNVYSQENSVEQLHMYWMTSNNTYDKLAIWGLLHQNFVYGGESVDTTGKEALVATVDDPTGFIVPLHFPTMQALGLKDATQMATANTFIIFNSYEIVKQKWYTTWWFMVIIIIVIIVITILTGGLGAGAGGSVGILGSAASVGAAVGLTGTAAIIAGTIINALVAIAVSQIISYGSKKLFGDKWGAIIATVINLAITLGTSGVSFDNLSELGTAANILKISSAISNGYAGYTQGAVAELGDELEDMSERYEQKSDDIDKLLRELMGTSGLNFDPLSLTDSVKGNDASGASGSQYIVETLDQFIGRTTMTGSDVVEVTLAMVNNYAGLSLELPR